MGKEKEFSIKKAISINEVNRLISPIKNCIRVYLYQSPDTFTFQIRGNTSILEFRKGKLRDMVASVDVNIKEMEQILDYMKKEVRT